MCSNPDCPRKDNILMAAVQAVVLRKGMTLPTGTKLLHVPKMKLCSRCRSAQYCSPECQKAHWAAAGDPHKAHCRKR